MGLPWERSIGKCVRTLIISMVSKLDRLMVPEFPFSSGKVGRRVELILYRCVVQKTRARGVSFQRIRVPPLNRSFILNVRMHTMLHEF
jgi:hypothetical protein